MHALDWIWRTRRPEKIPFRLLFVYKENNWNHPRESLIRVLRQNYEPVAFLPFNLRERPAELMRAIAKVRPDVVFVYDRCLTSEKVEEIKGCGIQIIMNCEGFKSFDVGVQPQAEALRELRMVDAYLVSHAPHVERLRAEGVRAYSLAHWYDPDWFKPLGIAKQYEVLFVGTNRGSSRAYRQPMLETVSKHFKLAVAGPREDFTDIPNAIKLGVVEDARKMNRLFAQSWIVLGTDRLTDEVVAMNKRVAQHIFYDLTHHIKHRTYSTLGSGACYAVEDHEEIRRQFIDGQEIILWRDFDHLVEQIDYYLKRPDEITRIGFNAHKRAFREHTTQVRLDHIFKILDEVMGRT